MCNHMANALGVLVSELNARGGILLSGRRRPLVIITADDGGNQVRVANITLSHILTRRDRLKFIGHSLRKAGLMATGTALTRKVRSKLANKPATVAQGVRG